jgi:DNA-directed RNA polymerase subunit RPC12/RpoP
VIYVKCNKCGHEFSSKLIQADEQSYKNMSLSSNYEPCPNCGKQALVDKSTISFK